MKAWCRGDPEGDLADGIMPSLRAFMDFQSFGVLPVSGGICDQDPLLVQDFRLIQSVIEKHEKGR